MIAGTSAADFKSLMSESRAESSGAASPILLASCFLAVPQAGFPSAIPPVLFATIGESVGRRADCSTRRRALSIGRRGESATGDQQRGQPFLPGPDRVWTDTLRPSQSW